MDYGVLLLIVLIVAFVLYGALRLLPDLRQPTLHRAARVCGRRRQEDAGTGWEPSVRHFVTFGFEDGPVGEFEVAERDFLRWTEGTTGTLITRGRWLRGFTPAQV